MSRTVTERRPDGKQLLRLLDSTDVQVSAEAVLIFRQQIASGECIGLLVEHYVNTESIKALEILSTFIREPYDKTLLDRLCDSIKLKPFETIGLLMKIVQKQPSWLPKLTQHSFFGAFLKMTKNSPDLVVRVSSLLLLVCLLPQTPLVTAHDLQDLFCIYRKSAEFLHRYLCSTNKSELSVPDSNSVDNLNKMYSVHLRLALYAYFQRLYGLFPCNFLTNLRSQFMAAHNPERQQLFKDIVKPMLAQVKLHPMLVLAGKDSELSKERWTRRETHDILDECNQVAVTCDHLRPETDRPFSSLSVTSSSGHWSMMSSCKATPVKPVRPTSLAPSTTSTTSLLPSITLPTLLHDDVRLAEHLWSPSMTVGLETPPQSCRATPVSLSRRESLKNYEPIGTTSDRRSTSREEGRHSSFSHAFNRIFRPARTSSTVKDSRTKPELAPSLSVPPSPMKKVASTDSSFKFSDNQLNQSSAKSLVIPVRMEEPIVLPIESPEELKPMLATIHSRQGSLISQAEEAEEAVEGEQKLTPLSELEAEAENWSAVNRASQDDSEIENLLRSRASFEVGENTDKPDIHFLPINQPTTTEDESPLLPPSRTEDESLPRLITSDSVADFMKKYNRNRFRYYSQCTTDTAEIDELTKTTAVNAEGVDNVDVKPVVRKRSWSCPHDKLHVNPTKRSSHEITALASAPIAPDVMVTRIMINDDQQHSSLDDSGHSTSKQSTNENQRGASLPPDWLTKFPYLPLMEFTMNSRKPSLPFQPEYQTSSLQGSTEVSYDQNEMLRKHSEGSVLNQYLRNSQELETLHRQNIVMERMSSRTEPAFVDTSKELPLEKQVDFLRVQLQLSSQQVQYEKFRRKVHEQRNRRLFGRLKQLKISEFEQNTNKERLHSQEMEIQNMIDALIGERKQKVNEKERHAAMEYRLNKQLQEKHAETESLLKAIEGLRRELAEFQSTNCNFKKLLGQSEQKLFDAQSQMTLTRQEATDMERLKSTNSELQQKLLLLQEQNRHAASIIPAYKQALIEKQCLEAKLASLMQSSNNEMISLKRQLKKERNRADANSQKAVDLESQLHKKMHKISELRRSFDGARATHSERLEALEQKYCSLLATCERQETYVTQLYQTIEQQALIANKSNPIHSASVGIPRRVGPAEIVSAGSSFGDNLLSGSNPPSCTSHLVQQELFRKNSRQIEQEIQRKEIEDIE